MIVFLATSSFKHLDTCTRTPTTPTFITEMLYLTSCVQLFKGMLKWKWWLYSDSLLILGRLLQHARANSKAMPTTNKDYHWHMKALTNHMKSISRYIMPLCSYQWPWGRHTQTSAHKKLLLLLITLWHSNYNEAMKYKWKVQNNILTISLAKLNAYICTKYS